MIKTVKKISLLFIISLLLGGVFSVNNAKTVSALNNGGLKVGTYLEAGYGIQPGSGSQYTFYIDTLKDTFEYSNGQYLYADTRSYSRNIPEGDSPELGLYYITKERTYVSKGSHTGGEYKIIDKPDAYYSNGNYIFYIYGKEMDQEINRTPITIKIAAEDEGPAWGLKVVSGDGSQNNPFTFALVREKPHDIIAKTESGSGRIELDYTRAEPGETVTFKAIPGSGQEVDHIQANTDQSIEITKNGDVYSFVMPSSHEGYETVTIHAWFKEIDEAFEVDDGKGTITSCKNYDFAEYEWKPGTTLRLKKNITEANALKPKNGAGDYYLDLNGFTYTVTVNNPAVEVNEGIKLTINDSSENKTGKLTHEKGISGCHGADVNNGELILVNGNISGNYGGVYLSSGSSFTMTGGKISDNNASTNGGGVYVSDSAIFTMSGGTINNNTSSLDGAGVYNAGTFNVSGNVTINNNKKGQAENNVAFASGKKINIANNLDANARIGIVYVPETVFTAGFDGKASVNNFISNVSGKVITATNTEPKEIMLDDEITYNLWVNGERVTSGNANAIPVESGSATYDLESNTLTLNNATILFRKLKYNTMAYDAGIFYVGNEPLTSTFKIKLIGNNVIKQSSNDDEFYGSYRAHGIKSYGNLEIDGKGDAGDGKLSIVYNKNDLDGIGQMNGINTFSNDIKISNADISIETDSGYLAYSIYTNDLSITESNVTIVNNADLDNATGIYVYSEDAAGKFEMDSDSTLEITSLGKAIDGNNGIANYNEAAKPENIGATVNTAPTADKAYPYTSSWRGLSNYKYVRMPKFPGFTIIWEDGDGNILKTDKVDSGVIPSYSGDTPTKSATEQESYTFNDSWDPEIHAADSDQTYTAQFDVTTRQYLIKFINDDGTVISEGNYDYGTVAQNIIPSENPSKAGYTFAGWKPTVTSVLQDQEYVATYTKKDKEYTATWYHYDSSIYKEAITGTIEQIQNAFPDDPSPTEAMQKNPEYTYTFLNWNSIVDDEKLTIDYYATFSAKKKEHIITWINEGEPISTSKLLYGAPLIYDGETPRKGDEYDFIGWNENADGTGRYLSGNERVTGAKTFYAQFKEKGKVTVEFISDRTIVEKQIVSSDTKITAPSGLEKKGYTLEGWYCDQGYTSKWDFDDTVTKDLKLYARWQSINYTVTLDAGSGSCTPTSLSVAYGTSYGRLPEAKKTGRLFGGWWLKDGDSFSEEVTSSTKVSIANDHTLYARYLMDVSFYVENRLYSGNHLYDDVDGIKAIRPANDPSKEGYQFMYWANADGSEFDFNNTITDNLKLYARFYQYEYDGGEVVWVAGASGKAKFTFVRNEFTKEKELSKLDLLEKFNNGDRRIYVDNNLLHEGDYSCENGSLIAYLNDSYLNTLSIGTHTLRVMFDDGEVSAPFKVIRKNNPDTPSYVIPKTAIE